MITVILLIIGLLLVVSSWLITNPGQVSLKKNFLHREIVPPTLIEVVIVIIQFIAYYLFPPVKTSLDTGLQIIGLVVFYSGILFAFWAKMTMKNSWGPPAQHDIKSQNELITAGPYQFSRNPIYVGLLVMAFGFSIALRSNLFFLNFVLVWYFHQMIMKEEGLLEKYFGESYTKYKKKAPRYL